ncbi:MAG: hypothetical protein R3E94_19425 [Burkholderiaceae bacterium]
MKLNDRGNRRIGMRVPALMLTALLAACGSTPAPPDWQMGAHASLGRAQQAALTGLTSIEAAEMARVRRELARTGRVDFMARAELGLCAVHVASLDFSACEAFDRLEVDAGEAEKAYARYLAGASLPGDAVWLPEVHKSLVAGAETARHALPSVADPLSRLVGAGVLMRRGEASPELLQLAVDTASAQGWSRPLLAWLGVQRERARTGGDAGQAERIQRRMDLILQSAR